MLNLSGEDFDQFPHVEMRLQSKHTTRSLGVEGASEFGSLRQVASCDRSPRRTEEAAMLRGMIASRDRRIYELEHEIGESCSFLPHARDMVHIAGVMESEESATSMIYGGLNGSGLALGSTTASSFGPSVESRTTVAPAPSCPSSFLPHAPLESGSCTARSGLRSCSELVAHSLPVSTENLSMTATSRSFVHTLTPRPAFGTTIPTPRGFFSMTPRGVAAVRHCIDGLDVVVTPHAQNYACSVTSPRRWQPVVMRSLSSPMLLGGQGQGTCIVPTSRRS